VVPSPVTSSCAVAVLAIMAAVGFWICISWSSTLPSLVSLMSPAPPTSLKRKEKERKKKKKKKKSVEFESKELKKSFESPYIFVVPFGPRFVLRTS